MQRFYANLLGRRTGLTSPMPKAEACARQKPAARATAAEVLALTAEMTGGVERSKGAKARQPAELAAAIPAVGKTTGRTRPRTTGPRSCWSATRIEKRSSPGCPIELGVSIPRQIVVDVNMVRFLQFFCIHCPCQPNATTMRTTAGAIVDPENSLKSTPIPHQPNTRRMADAPDSKSGSSAMSLIPQR